MVNFWSTTVGQFFAKLSTRLFLPLVAILILVTIILVIYIPSVTKENAIASAIKSAESTVKQYKAIRGYYTKNVIKKIVKGKEFKPHFEHEGQQNVIPLPATFIHDISETFSKEKIIALKLYSPYPFPNRSTRQLDSFGNKAWAALLKSPNQIFSSVEDVNGKKTVRVAIADTMTAQGCVNCHNSHPDTPKKGWKLNDMRGVLEVQVPIEFQLENATKLNMTISLIMMSVLLATATLVFYMFRRLISERLRKVHAALIEIGQGDGNLSKALNDQPNDEIGVIATAFNQFTAQLAKTLSRINTQVSQLTEATDKMENITQSTKGNTSNQLSAIEQVSESMTDVANATNDLNDIAKHTKEETVETQSLTSKSSHIVEQNLATIKSFAKEMQHVSDVVNQLEQDSQNIGGVLDVIRGIAEQTNLLALNAAIEAARAGEQGRGFAVVADEVRTLASRTQESTEEINSMIEQLQRGAKEAVDAIQGGQEQLQNSESMATETNEMIENVSSSIHNINQQNSHLSNAATTQANVSQEINENIQNIRSVADETNAHSSELLALASEINQSVIKINKQLSKFSQ